MLIDASKKNNQNNGCENSNFQISTNNQKLKMLNMKNNDDIDIGENSQKYSSEFSVNGEDDSFNINQFNNSIPNYFVIKVIIIFYII